MKKENGYEVIKEKLQERLDECRKYLRDISTETILNKSLREVQELKDFCDEEYKTMTAILMVDLYHIIGMVDFTTRQVQEFHKMMHEYSGYRPNLEEVRKTLTTITDLPKVPKKTRFALIGLKGIRLVSGPADAEEVEEFCDIDDYKSIRSGSVSQSTINKNISKQEAVGDCKEIADKVDDVSEEPIIKSKHMTIKKDGTNYIWKIKDSQQGFEEATAALLKSQHPKFSWEMIHIMVGSNVTSITKKIRAGEGYGLKYFKADDYWCAFIDGIDGNQIKIVEAIINYQM